MEFLLTKIPQTDLAAWRSLYLKLGTNEYRDLLAYLSKTSLIERSVPIREWLNSKDIYGDSDNDLLRRRVEDHFRGKKVVPSGQQLKPQEVHTMAILQILHRYKMQPSRLACLIVQDINEQLKNHGVIGATIVHEEDIRFTTNPSPGLRTISLDMGETKIWLFAAVSLDLPRINNRLQGYRILAQIEYCYLRRFIEPFYKSFLVDNYSCHLEDKPFTLYTLLNSNVKGQEDWNRSFRHAIIATFVDTVAPILGDGIYSRFLLETETDFVKDLISRTVSEDGINEEFLRANIKLHYPHL